MLQVPDVGEKICNQDADPISRHYADWKSPCHHEIAENSEITAPPPNGGKFLRLLHSYL
jgi:hypothetical protein